MIVRQHKSSHKKKVTLTQFGTVLLTQLSESCTAGVANCPCVRRKQEAPLQMTPAAACLKRHSCEICLSNYLLDLEPKMPKHFSSILSSFFSNAVSETFSDSFSKLCYALRGTCQKGPSKFPRR